jgi:excisionase family DNA binding protein
LKIKASRPGGGKDDMEKTQYKSFEDLPLMLSVPDLASVLGISRTRAYELAREKDFPALTIGARILVPRDKLIAWIDAKSATE